MSINTQTFQSLNDGLKITPLVQQIGALVLVDVVQSVLYMGVNVESEDWDFLAFSEHKMLASMGIDVLYSFILKRLSLIK